jgi:hypothetical protein
MGTMFIASSLEDEATPVEDAIATSARPHAARPDNP